MPVTVTDSRGYTATITLKVQVLNWTAPTAIITLKRHNNYYSETDLKVDSNYASEIANNVLTIKARYKKTAVDTWSDYITLQDDVTQQQTLDNTFAWDVQVVVSDSFVSTTYNLVLNRGMPLAFFDDKKLSVGFNCFPRRSQSLEVNGIGLSEVELYNDSTGTSGTVTLSESAENFTYIEIFYRSNDLDFGSVKIYQPNGKKACLMLATPFSGTILYLKTARLAISDTSIYKESENELELQNGRSISAYSASNIYITRVVGYA